MTQNEFLQRCYQMLTRDEGVVRTPYDDATGLPIKAPKGNVTIGVGHNLDAKPLSNGAILAILTDDVEEATLVAQDIVGLAVWAKLSLNRRLALINLAFSLGPSGLRSFKKMLAAVAGSDWSKAGSELRNSLWARQVDTAQVPNQGRDDRVVRLLEDDEYEY